MTLSRPLRQIFFNAYQLYNQSEATAKRAEKLLRNLRTQLRGEIASASAGGLADIITVRQSKQLLGQIDLHLAAASKALARDVESDLQALYNQQYQETLEEIRYLNQVPGAGVYSASEMKMISSLRPKLTGHFVIATFESTMTQVRALPGSVRESIRQTIALGTLRSESFISLSNKIVGQGLSLDGIQSGVFKTVHDRAKAIVITETTRIYNTARLEAIETSNHRLPAGKQLSMRWSALLDKRTSETCRHLNGKIVKPGEDFQHGRFKGPTPPAHPRCRSTIIAYRPEWESVLEELELELDKRKAGA